GVVDVPAEDCSATTDSAPALESFLAQVQNGSTVRFPSDGECMVALTLNLGYPPPGQTSRADATYDLNGATIFRTTEPECTPNRDCNGPVVAMDGVDHMTLENGTISGGGPTTDAPTYNPANEHDSGLRLHGDSEITVTGMTIQNVGGDCIDLDVNAFSQNTPDTNIWIGTKPEQPFVCSGAGRQGISANAVDGLTIQGATIERIAHSAIDLEPRKNGYLRNITVSGNHLGASGVSEIAAHGASMITSDVTITGNAQTGESPLFISAGNKSQRGPMTVTGNRFLSPAYIVHFSGSASGNTLTGPTSGCMFQIDGSGGSQRPATPSPPG
ncbi:MAG: right-handed parallel beta-helix repeat-containing protein, partial [Actinomycetota bacterium]